MKPPLRVMENTRHLRHTRAEAGAVLRRIEARITTLAGGCWAVRGVSGVFRSHADAAAAARRLDRPD